MKLHNRLLGSAALSVVMMLGLTGCGSKSEDSTSTTSTGFYLDSAVEGIDYTTSSGLTGETASTGAFKFHTGDTVTFKIGDLVLRVQSSIQDGDKVYETDDKAITLLQSIDVDGNASNGITLNADIKAAIATWLNGATSVDLNNSDNKIANMSGLKAALVAVGVTGTTNVDVIAARAHVAETAVAAALEGVAAGDEIPFGDGAFSPFERVAIFPTVKDGSGNVDYNATNAKIQELAVTLGKYIANTDETTDNITFPGVNWIVAGLDSSTAVNNFNDGNVSEHAVLSIPTKLLMNPALPASVANTRKVKVVEVCNSSYAGQALGVVNVGGVNGAKVANGIYHATALPCEISIYYDDNGIYVDMLNPETIFTTFFTEVFTSAEMLNPDFRNAMMALPTQVKSEIYALIYNAFDGASETYQKTSIKMGTIYSSMSQALATTDTASGGSEPYRHYTYTSDNAKEFTSADAKLIAQTLIQVLTSDADGANVGHQEAALTALLPSTIAGATPLWRSGRLEPLKVPGGSYIVESCSPVYAKEALATGSYHTPALPCEIAVFVNPDNNTSIDVSFLNPEFMFGALFADGMVGMSADQIAAFGTIISNINGDLKTIVDYAMEHNVTTGSFDGTNVKITPVNY